MVKIRILKDKAVKKGTFATLCYAKNEVFETSEQNAKRLVNAKHASFNLDATSEPKKEKDKKGGPK